MSRACSCFVLPSYRLRPLSHQYLDWMTEALKLEYQDIDGQLETWLSCLTTLDEEFTPGGLR